MKASTIALLFMIVCVTTLSAQDNWNITRTSSLDYPWATQVEEADGYAYLVSGSEGLKIIDVSDPYLPQEVATFPAQDFAMDVAVYQSYAYFSDGHGLNILDVSDPTNPLLVGTGEPIDARELTVYNGYGYALTTMSNYIAIVDMSDPANPVSVGYYNPNSAWAAGIAIADDYLYVPGILGGFYVVDISNPLDPVEVGTCDLTYGANDVAVSGNYALVPHGTGAVMALKVFNIADPTNPYWECDCYLDGIANDIKVSGNHAYIADYNNAVRIYNIEDPTNPIQVGYCLTGTGVLEIDYDGQYAYTAEETALGIYDCSEALPVELPATSPSPFSLMLLEAYPNPFNVETILYYSLPMAGYVNLSVFDVFGRRITTLVDGIAEAGAHETVFDGADLPTGLYFSRLSTETSDRICKLVLVK